jgi:hypothetical protein
VPFRSYLPFFTLHPFFVSLSFGIFGCIDPRRDCTSFHGKKGMKAQRECSWKKIKSKTITFHMLTQRGLENNEMFLLKNQRPAKKYTYIKMSHLLRDLHKCVTCLGFLYPYTLVYLSLQVTLWYFPPSFYVTHRSTLASFWTLIN